MLYVYNTYITAALLYYVEYANNKFSVGKCKWGPITKSKTTKSTFYGSNVYRLYSIRWTHEEYCIVSIGA